MEKEEASESKVSSTTTGLRTHTQEKEVYGGLVRTERSDAGEETAKSLLKGMDKREKGQSESTNSLKGVVRK